VATARSRSPTGMPSCDSDWNRRPANSTSNSESTVCDTSQWTVHRSSSGAGRDAAMDSARIPLHGHCAQHVNGRSNHDSTRAVSESGRVANAAQRLQLLKSRWTQIPPLVRHRDWHESQSPVTVVTSTVQVHECHWQCSDSAHTGAAWGRAASVAGVVCNANLRCTFVCWCSVRGDPASSRPCTDWQAASARRSKPRRPRAGRTHTLRGE
jgi:hypothetical protein